jgi:cyclic-di-AMP phosphodiesterase PgpH
MKTTSYKEHFSRVGVAVVVIVLIAFLFPIQSQFQYYFELNRTWNHNDLYAPYDFAIKKSDKEIVAENANIEKNAIPYYYIKDDIATEQLKRYEQEFNMQFATLPDQLKSAELINKRKKYYEIGEHILQSCFERGILETTHPKHEKDAVIAVTHNNDIYYHVIGDFYNKLGMTRAITDSLFAKQITETTFLVSVIEKCIEPNVFFDKALSEKNIKTEKESISFTHDIVRRGDLIVRKGATINEEIYQKLISYKDNYENSVTTRSRWVVFFGYLWMTTLVVILFVMFLYFHLKEVFSVLKNHVFLFSWVVVFVYITHWVVNVHSALSPYMIPYCIAPIVIRNFYNLRLALFTHIITILMVSFLFSLGYEFTVMQLAAGSVAVLVNTQVRYWSEFFFSLLFILFAYLGISFGLGLIQEGTLSSLDNTDVFPIFVNVFLTLLAYPLLPILESAFGFSSPSTISNLFDVHHPLIQLLSENAPGTYQHSLNVANIAEAAADIIGADGALVKTAALFHDIGKTKNAQFFIENQSDRWMHEGFSPLQSAQIIMGHVDEGVRLAEKYHLPARIIAFIRSHHGTTRVEFFYQKQFKKQPLSPVEEAQFRYAGPKPQTKEEVILMLADSLEAASKTLNHPTAEEVYELVDKIVMGKIKLGQLDAANITFEELNKCKDSFKKSLKSMMHLRIAYPENDN